ncbi:MAG: PQQ-binding-like beta-propeller repeat protein [Planctomycetota bacterium]
MNFYQKYQSNSNLTQTAFPKLSILVMAFALAAMLFAEGMAQEEWSRFRGPNGTGLSGDDSLPKEVKEENVQWKLKLPGTGSSSPVIWKERLFLTSYHDKQLIVEGIDLQTGKSIWQTPFELDPPRVHRLNSFASSTPAVDDKHVYVTFADSKSSQLVALDHDGNVVWKKDLGYFQSQHGYGASPIVYDDQVILFHSQQADRVRRGAKPGSSHVIALSCENGDEQWRTPLKTTRACYAVPAIVKNENGEPLLVSCNTGDGFFGLNPTTGKLIWSTEPFRMRTVASMVCAGDLLLGSCGSGGGGNYLVAARMNSDSQREPTRAYSIQKANYVPTPIAVNEQLYLFTDKGIVRCFELDTGKLVWEKRMADGFSGSPVSANGLIYVVDDSGELLVLDADKKSDAVSKFSLGESSSATPAIANGQLLIRTDSTLFCID